ncbi:MAG: glycosyltransferase [Verrucomicrobiales bacterium]|nr:glycosyltransferase [Verrucomicrobiales bacterium]
MSWILAVLTGLALGLLLWQWFEAIRFPLHRRKVAAGFAPGLTLLKPLKGADSETEACLRSWLTLDYAGPVQVLFGVADAEDPAAAVVRRLQTEFPQADVELVVCTGRLGPNSKVSKLAQLEPRARHTVLVVSDADVAVPPDFLAQLVQPFGEAGVGLVTPFYQLATPATAAMHWEALAVNADFWSSVLQAVRLGPMRFALGAVMAVRREVLQAIGGFGSLVHYLADDFELGQRVTGRRPTASPAEPGVVEGDRYRIAVCPVVVACRESPRGWGAIWRHQVRWARTIRHCQPGPYALSVLSNPTLWPVLGVLAAPASVLAWTGLAVCLGTRLGMAAHCQARLRRSWAHLRWVWLAPVKDLLGAVLWAWAFLGQTIEWRGERYRVRRGGRLEPLVGRVERVPAD